MKPKCSDMSTVFIVLDKFTTIIREKMQLALNTASAWATSEDLWINPRKITSVPSTMSGEAKHIGGVNLNSNLTWNQHC